MDHIFLLLLSTNCIINIVNKEILLLLYEFRSERIKTWIFPSTGAKVITFFQQKLQNYEKMKGSTLS